MRRNAHRSDHLIAEDPTLAAIRAESAANDKLAAERTAPRPQFAEPDDITARPSQMRPAPPLDPAFEPRTFYVAPRTPDDQALDRIVEWYLGTDWRSKPPPPLPASEPLPPLPSEVEE
ncbi:MAG TPA: hypothetical protein VGJ59_01695 [Jatrophihabitantaceae bacterium]